MKRLRRWLITAAIVLGLALPAIAAPWGTHYHNWPAIVDACTTHGYVSDGAQKRHRTEIAVVYYNNGQAVGCDIRARFQSYITAKRTWVTVDTDMHYYPFG